MTGFGATLLSILMIAFFALAAGGVWLIVRARDRRKGALMIIAAIVLLGNVLAWSI